MSLSTATIRARLQAQIAPGNDTEFFRLLTEADERLLNMGRWSWTRQLATLTVDSDRLIALPDEFESIVGCRIGEVAAGVSWQELEFLEGGPGLIDVQGCPARLIDQGLREYGSDSSSQLTRTYKITDEETEEVTALCRLASTTFTLATENTDETACPSLAALKQMMLSIIYEESNDTKISMEYQQKAKMTLDDQESAYRGTARNVFKSSMTLPLRRRSKSNFP